MPRLAKLPKARIAEILSSVFTSYGYEGASLAMLAKAAGLSKASLYHHFPNGKKDMAAHALGQAGARFQKLILLPLQSGKGAHDRLLHSFDGVAIYYDGAIPACLMNSLMLGSGANLFGKEIARALEAWEAGLSGAYQELGTPDREAHARACRVIDRLQGTLVRCRIEQSRVPLEACLDELRKI